MDLNNPASDDPWWLSAGRVSEILWCIQLAHQPVGPHVALVEGGGFPTSSILEHQMDVPASGLVFVASPFRGVADWHIGVQ